MAKPALSKKEINEIDLWIEQRRNKFPKAGKVASNSSSIQNKGGEISELERKLRKKLSFIVSQMTGDKKERRDNKRQEREVKVQNAEQPIKSQEEK